jgi:hypothetical protein
MVLNFAPFGTDNDFSRPSGTGLPLCTYAGTSCLATIGLSLRDENHSTIEAPRIKLTLMGVASRAVVRAKPPSLAFSIILLPSCKLLRSPSEDDYARAPNRYAFSETGTASGGRFYHSHRKGKKIQLTRSDRADTVNQL